MLYWKIQVICYQMGTDIFKIEEEMTEKMNFMLHFLSHFFFNFKNLSAHLVANNLNFPKQPQHLQFG